MRDALVAETAKRRKKLGFKELKKDFITTEDISSSTDDAQMLHMRDRLNTHHLHNHYIQRMNVRHRGCVQGLCSCDAPAHHVNSPHDNAFPKVVGMTILYIWTIFYIWAICTFLLAQS